MRIIKIDIGILLKDSFMQMIPQLIEMFQPYIPLVVLSILNVIGLMVLKRFIFEYYTLSGYSHSAAKKRVRTTGKIFDFISAANNIINLYKK